MNEESKQDKDHETVNGDVEETTADHKEDQGNQDEGFFDNVNDTVKDEFEKVEILMKRAQEECDHVRDEVKKKYPGVRMFSVVTPYSGVYIVRAQDVADIKASTKAVDKYIDDEIVKEGGREKLSAMPESERNIIVQRINAEAADISNDISLSRCVLYPYDFGKMVETGEGIPAGVYPLLIEKIYEVSGWQDVDVEEI